MHGHWIFYNVGQLAPRYGQFAKLACQNVPNLGSTCVVIVMLESYIDQGPSSPPPPSLSLSLSLSLCFFFRCCPKMENTSFHAKGKLD